MIWVGLGSAKACPVVDYLRLKACLGGQRLHAKVMKYYGASLKTVAWVLRCRDPSSKSPISQA